MTLSTLSLIFPNSTEVSAGMIQIKDKAHFRKVLNSLGTQKCLIVKYSTDWCGPCRMIAKSYTRLEKESQKKLGNLVFAEVCLFNLFNYLIMQLLIANLFFVFGPSTAAGFCHRLFEESARFFTILTESTKQCDVDIAPAVAEDEGITCLPTIAGKTIAKRVTWQILMQCSVLFDLVVFCIPCIGIFARHAM